MNKIAANLRDPRLRPGARSRRRRRSPWLDAHGRTFGHFINGKWTKPGKTFASDNPANGETLAQITDGTAADVDKAVKAARAAFKPWSRSRATSAASISMPSPG